MNFKNFGKIALVALFVSFVSGTVDKIEKRPTGTYPTPKRLVLVAAGAIGLNYGCAYVEQKLGLNEKNVKFPFKD